MENCTTAEVTITPVKVKKEIITEDIKEFAETAMNELLGWYGYENPNKEKSRAPKTCRSQSESNSSGLESPKLLAAEGCGWCGKTIEEPSNCLSSAASNFCSELCFSQSRRANFKKNKTCDWCRHVRHTVSYVDFQDGASQLQFCSDKCLNQYKMHIFCRETTAHLELHPHLHGDDASSGTLITPDLWLRNCKSPNESDAQHHVTTTCSSRPTSSESCASVQLTQTSPLNLIGRTGGGQVMGTEKRSRGKVHKKIRKRCPSTVTSATSTVFSTPINNDTPQDLRVIRHVNVSTPPLDLAEAKKDKINPSTLVKIDQKKDKPSLEDKCLLPKITANEFFTSKMFSNTLLRSPPLGNFSRMLKSASPPNQNASTPQNTSQTSEVKTILDNILPPPTVFMPYPVILPLPIPIPIPIPIPKIFTVNEKNSEIILEKKDIETQTEMVVETNGLERIEDLDEKVGDVEEDKMENQSEKRYLRKRRKAVEPKSSRLTVKSRKLLSVPLNSNL